jgi:hypothetical protein
VLSLADGVRLVSLLDVRRAPRRWKPSQAYVALPEDQRRAVRKEVRCGLDDTGGPIEVEVEISFASRIR